MRLAEFDEYAANYEQLVSESVRISGESSDYFAAYKADYIARKIAPAPGTSLLDYGCGVGRLSTHLKKRLPGTRVDGFDVSKSSVGQAESSLLSQGTFTTDQNELLAAYDVIVLANVLHHVRPDERYALLKRISSRLAEGGKIVVFEHNPLNPLTRRAVADCVFDKGVELLPSREVRDYFRRDFEHVSQDYIVFFPRSLSLLRPVEKYLGWCPVGAQYTVVASRPS
jgi:2-polyprenyl-3-methyl-5-hydroxy-6-metoxy-1,4-benzoquinol methylase